MSTLLQLTNFTVGWVSDRVTQQNASFGFRVALPNLYRNSLSVNQTANSAKILYWVVLYVARMAK